MWILKLFCLLTVLVPFLLWTSNSGVFRSFLRALTSWLLSKKRGINGPSGERASSSDTLFPSAFCPRRPGLPEGDSSSLVSGGGGGGGGGGGEIGDARNEDKEQGEQEESAGLGTGSGGSDAVCAVVGWVVSVELGLGSVCTLVLRHNGWPCFCIQTESAHFSLKLLISTLLPSFLVLWAVRSRVDFRITWPGYR